MYKMQCMLQLCALLVIWVRRCRCYHHARLTLMWELLVELSILSVCACVSYEQINGNEANVERCGAASVRRIMSSNAFNLIKFNKNERTKEMTEIGRLCVLDESPRKWLDFTTESRSESKNNRVFAWIYLPNSERCKTVFDMRRMAFVIRLSVNSRRN